MTNTYKNVYIKETSTIAGIYEANGPLKKYYDKLYTKDLYFGEKSWEKAEIKLLKDTNHNPKERNYLKVQMIWIY